MRPHEKLKLWKKAIDFVVRLYALTNSFPKEEKFGLTSQLRRAAVSVPANIAEGAGRQSDKEFLYFLSNAQGSASELATELLIARRLGYLTRREFAEANEELDHIGRMIVGLAQSVKIRVGDRR
ncbi:MAG TPA: four helix bundle protein [Pyrinomonadaceae bacterium]|nr:four helix bundle protein [Pyrinomonadaceae bacterium]